MIRTAALALIALAAAGAIATPAAAQQARQISHQQAVAQGPGGCQEFNTALAAAVATQIRTGKHAEAQRLARMAVPCPRR
jgi:hypothetical protein